MIKSHIKNKTSRVIQSSHCDEIVPNPHPEPFKDGIAHPNLYLWDVWSAFTNDTLHLYCLAVSNKDEKGGVFPAGNRNDKSFHIRHFVSQDKGQSWLDRGCFQRARLGQDLFDSRSIWSGSILPLSDGRKLMGYTGIREQGNTLTFHQSLALSISDDWETAKSGSQTLISDPTTDYKKITDHGYFLGDVELLGHKDGEANGPIMAWRDPYLLSHDGQIHMFWSAKFDSKSPALGHALLTETDSGFAMTKLYRAIAMPDGHEYTQLELPKVMYDDARDRFLMLVSSCNRIHEGQNEEESDKRMRLYTSQSLEGPWHECGHSGSTLTLAQPNMFGICVIDADYQAQTLRYIAPFTEVAGASKLLTLSKTHSLDISDLGGAKTQSTITKVEGS